MMDPDVLLVRYGELSLKGGNRDVFEKALIENIRAAVQPISSVEIRRHRGRIVVAPSRRKTVVAQRLQDVFGIASISPAWRCEPEPEPIAELGKRVFAQAFEQFPGEGEVTVRVQTSRSDKAFPMTSSEVDLLVAERALPDSDRLRVRMKDPMLTLGIDVRSEGAFVFASRIPGPGGLPTGTQGRALCLLSGGFDSAVASWMILKRGCSLDYVTFHSAPFIGEPAKKKVVDLVRVLARYQRHSRLHVVPFAGVQTAIRDSRAPSSYRTVLYRRSMHRIAAGIAEHRRAQAVVTGESLGQVASQTLENIACIGDAQPLPILRPLIGMDKLEIIDLARRIGTHDISALQEPDCCTLFMPSRPVIRGKIDVCREIEESLGLGELERDAVEQREIERFETAHAGA